MIKKLSKRFIIFAAAALVAGGGSYAAGRTGTDSPQAFTVNIPKAITESRCRAGAFISDANVPKDLKTDPAATTQVAANANEHDAATTVFKPAAAVGANLLPNAGVETLSGANPTGWSNTKNGNNDGSFTQVAGHNSNRALRVDITKYSDGTAYWTAGSTAVKPGGYYEYSDFYRANVTSRAVLMLKDDAGKVQFINLATVPVSTSWTQYVTRFFVPANVKEIAVFHTLDRLGSLETDDFVLTESTPGQFTDPIVSITFDDGWESVHQNALPIMERYNVVSTQYVISGFLGKKGYDTTADLYEFRDAGHEVAAHSFDHRDLTSVSDKDLTKELKTPHDGLSKCYGNTTDFAHPYGSYNAAITKAVGDIYQTGRTTDPGFNSADYFNPLELKVQNITKDTTPAELQAWLDTAKAGHTWLILVYHQVDDSDGAFARKPADFEADIQKIAASGMKIETVHDAYSEIQPQVKP